MKDLSTYEAKYNLVAEFQKVANVKTSPDIQRLYIKLFSEEALEFNLNVHDYFFNRNEFKFLVESFDGVADMMVIQMGSHYHQVPSAVLMQNTVVNSIAYLATVVAKNLSNHKINMVNLVNEVFEEVMRSNMSKFCQDEEQAIASVDAYAREGLEVYYELFNDWYIIKSSKDQNNAKGELVPNEKILKAVTYTKPNIEPIIREHMIRGTIN